jgi:hypothetical protein
LRQQAFFYDMKKTKPTPEQTNAAQGIAELIYALFIEQEERAIIENGQNNAQTSDN